MKKLLVNADRYEVIVDDDDYADVMEAAERYKWHVCARDDNPRRVRCGPQRGPHIYLHRFIMNPNDNEYVRYLDGNALDNRKENLRILSKSQACQGSKRKNQGSSSGYIGVIKSGRGWVAQCVAFGVTHRLGYYAEEIHAARAYDIAAKKHHGELALTNNIPEDVVPVKSSRLSNRKGRSSIYIGVYKNKVNNTWVAMIWVEGKRKYLGCYGMQIHAARVYDIAVKKYRGPDAITNNISKDVIPVRCDQRKK